MIKNVVWYYMTENLLKTLQVINPILSKNGVVFEVTTNNFPILNGVTCFILEEYHDAMRLPHWHPNAYELGYLISGKLEIYMWKYAGESSKYTVCAGSCWFIPQGAMHSLNNVGNGTAKMAIGFNSANPKNTDLPTAFNGIPLPIKAAYTSPHSDLTKWSGILKSTYFGELYNLVPPETNISSPYVINLSQISPLFNNGRLGLVTWAIKENWKILEGLSIIKVILKPNTCRDPIWYPDADILYVTIRGSAVFNITSADQIPLNYTTNPNDYVYVHEGVLHSFINRSATTDLEVIGFFNKVNPQPEVSLLFTVNFFPNRILENALLKYDGHPHYPKGLNPIKGLKNPRSTPYILKLENMDCAESAESMESTESTESTENSSCESCENYS